MMPRKRVRKATKTTQPLTIKWIGDVPKDLVPGELDLLLSYRDELLKPLIEMYGQRLNIEADAVGQDPGGENAH